MARKQIRETKFSSILRSSVGGGYDVNRVETRIDDGFSDILLLRKSDGAACLLELKQIDHFTNTGYTRLDLDPIQAIFLWERVKACDYIGAAVMLRVGERDIYTFPARKEPQWCHWIRSKIYPDQLSLPLCLKHSISQLPTALDAAFNARFTPAGLAPVE